MQDVYDPSEADPEWQIFACLSSRNASRGRGCDSAQPFYRSWLYWALLHACGFADHLYCHLSVFQFVADPGGPGQRAQAVHQQVLYNTKSRDEQRCCVAVQGTAAARTSLASARQGMVAATCSSVDQAALLPRCQDTLSHLLGCSPGARDALLHARSTVDATRPSLPSSELHS